MAGRTCTPVAETFMMARGRMRTQNSAEWRRWQAACDREGLSCAAVKTKVVALAKLCEAAADLIGALLGEWRAAQTGDIDRVALVERPGTGYDEGTLRKCAYVARNIQFLRRRENLTFSVHSELAGLSTAEDQDRWLDRAEAEQAKNKSLEIDADSVNTLPTCRHHSKVRC
jgi:hypothetical protein